MSSKGLLELNVRAKKTHPAVPQNVPEGTLILEVGKKYITACGAVVGPLLVDPFSDEEGDALVAGEGEWNEQLKAPKNYWYFSRKGGLFVGYDHTDPRRIVREWHPTWKFEEAWWAGKQVEYKHPLPQFGWLSVQYKEDIVADAFGRDSKTYKEWWMKHYAGLFMEYEGRIK